MLLSCCSGPNPLRTIIMSGVLNKVLQAVWFIHLKKEKKRKRKAQNSAMRIPEDMRV